MKTICMIVAAAILRMTAIGSEEATASNGMVVHEWGTFTSVQGADGAQMKWNPFTAEELPKFVYSLNQPGIKSPLAMAYLLSKPNLVALQRMETPVIYFYSDKDMTVDLTVEFPEGTITEWYPQASEIGRFTPAPNGGKIKNYLTWSDLHISAKPETAERSSLLPHDPSGSHYYEARNTAAALVRAKNAERKEEWEKFLFYRGVGDFQAPLKTSLPDTETIRLENTGGMELGNLFVYEVRKGQGQFAYIERLAPGESRVVRRAAPEDLVSFSALQEKIAARMRQGLVGEGLFPDEAKAMTDTWKDSWFGEEGLRVLYTLSKEWTDEKLPLNVEPAPAAVVRVMVGRAEVITPEIETQLFEQITRFSMADASAKAQVIADTRKLGLGRFAEPALRRVLQQNPGQERKQAGWKLIEEARCPEEPTIASIDPWNLEALLDCSGGFSAHRD